MFVGVCLWEECAQCTLAFIAEGDIERLSLDFFLFLLDTFLNAQVVCTETLFLFV